MLNPEDDWNVSLKCFWKRNLVLILDALVTVLLIVYFNILTIYIYIYIRVGWISWKNLLPEKSKIICCGQSQQMDRFQSDKNSRLPCYVFGTCYMYAYMTTTNRQTTNRNPNVNNLSWAINYDKKDINFGQIMFGKSSKNHHFFGCRLS